MTRAFAVRPATAIAALGALPWLALALPAAAEPAAQIDFAIGNVIAQKPDGTRRVLSKGSDLSSGDSVLTNDGRAQMRFTDGALVSLKPGSEFRIDDYRFNGTPDGEERGFFSLLKGGLRTITGWIGRSDRSKYRVNAVVATIGIRGTEYSATYDNGINVNTAAGIVEVCSNAGCLLLFPGDEGYVAGANVEPVLVQTGQERPKKDDSPHPPHSLESPSNDRRGRGETGALEGTAGGSLKLTGSQTYTVAWGLTQQASSRSTRDLNSGPGTIANSGALVSLSDPSASSFFDPNLAGGTSTRVLGNDGIVAWGRWDGGAGGLLACQACSPTTPPSGTPGDIFHYVAGLPTLDAPATLPNATYTLIGGSVSGTSSGIGSISSGSISATFSVPEITSLSLATSVGGRSYGLALGSPLPISSSPGGLSFGGSVGVNGGSCGTSCPLAGVGGAFFGPAATRAGLSFSFSDPVANESIAGAAAFRKN